MLGLTGEEKREDLKCQRGAREDYLSIGREGGERNGDQKELLVTSRKQEGRK